MSEGFPNVVGGGHGCGVPCVVTDVGDCAAIVGDIARVVPPKDPAALAVAWQRTLVLDPAARRRLGEPARARVEAHFGLSGVVRRYEDLYASLARG